MVGGGPADVLVGDPLGATVGVSLACPVIVGVAVTEMEVIVTVAVAESEVIATVAVVEREVIVGVAVAEGGVAVALGVAGRRVVVAVGKGAGVSAGSPGNVSAMISARFVYPSPSESTFSIGANWCPAPWYAMPYALSCGGLV